MAAAVGVSAMAWSRWESGQRTVPINTIRPILKAKAQELGLPWSDSWLFEPPVCNQCVGVDQCGAGCARIVAGCAAIRDGDRAEGLSLLADGCCADDFKTGHGVSPVVDDETQLAFVSNGNLVPKISQQVLS